MNDTYGLKDDYPYGIYIWSQDYDPTRKAHAYHWRLAYMCATPGDAAMLQQEIEYGSGKVCMVAPR